MPIDQPLAAFRAVVKNDIHDSPNDGGRLVLEAAAVILELLPCAVGQVAVGALGLLLRRRALNLEELLTVIDEEFIYQKRLIDKLGQESEAHRRFREEEWTGLVIDACQKAADARSKGRIRWIGRILVSAVAVDPPPEAGDVEELMRVATVLGDRDVVFLRELYRSQLRFYSETEGVVDADEEIDGRRTIRPGIWPVDDLRNLGYDQASLIAVPAKLASLGLVQPYEWLCGAPYPYHMLRKGKMFVESARAAVA